MSELEDLQLWLKKLVAEDSLIIVEGKKDKAALEAEGITTVLPLSKSIFETAEEAAKKEKVVRILTDLDKKGKEIFGKLHKTLTREGVKVKTDFREFLFKKTQLRQIEGLTRYINRLKRKTPKI